MGHFFYGITSCWQGLNIAYQPQYRRWLLLIIGINFSLMLGITWYGFNLGMHWYETAQSPWLHSLWSNWFGLTLDFILLLGFAFLCFYIFSAIFSGPLLGFLCQQHLRDIGLLSDADTQRGFLASIGASFTREIHKLCYFTPRWLAVIALSLIPIVNIFVWLVWSARLVAMQYVDYPLDQRGLTFAQLKPHLRRHKGLYWGLGLTLQLVLLIPIFNVFLIPGAIIAANLSYQRALSA